VIMGHYTVPTVVEKTPAGERVVDVFSRLLSDRIVYLGTEIDDDVANLLVAHCSIWSRTIPTGRSPFTSILREARCRR